MNNQTQVAPIALTISSISVRQDDQGRYCLNDLHKASGNNQKHRPSYWLETKQVKDLIAEIENTAGIPAVEVINGGKFRGTYVVKELVYAYAMWISASFSLKVIRAYDALQGGQPKAPPSTSSIETFQVRILTTFTRGDEPTQQIVPYNSCVVDGENPVAVATFIREYVPSTPEMLAALSSAYITKLMDCQAATIKSTKGN